MAWADAESSCSSRQGHLVIVRSRLENRVVQALCDEACWLGYTKMEGDWRWSDQSSSTGFSAWRAEVPNGLGSAAAAYAVLGHWDAAPPTALMPYVCARASDLAAPAISALALGSLAPFAVALLLVVLALLQHCSSASGARWRPWRCQGQPPSPLASCGRPLRSPPRPLRCP